MWGKVSKNCIKEKTRKTNIIATNFEQLIIIIVVGEAYGSSGQRVVASTQQRI